MPPRTLTRTMSDTISFKLQTGRGSGGVPTWGALLTCAGKWWSKRQLVTNGSGASLITKHYCHTFTKIPRGSLVFGPDDDTSDDNNGHIVDICNAFSSAAVRGTQWTMYEIKVQ